MKKVFVTDKSWPSYDKFEAEIQAAGGAFAYASAQDEATLIKECRDADVIVNSFAKVTAAVIEQLEHCETIIRTGISVDTIDVAAATKKGVKVCFVPDYCRDEVADHTVALALASSMKLGLYLRRMQEGVWNSVEAGNVPRLRNAACALIGFGGIAKKVATRLMAFGVSVRAYDPYLDDAVFRDAGVTRASSVEEAVKGADIVSLHLPLNDGTHHVINENIFNGMKDGVTFVNTSRGGLVDTDALLKALDDGKVGAAGLDVFEKEPLDKDHPLLTHKNVFVTPHAAYYSSESLPELVAKSTDEAVRVLKGEQNRIIYNKDALGL